MLYRNDFLLIRKVTYNASGEAAPFDHDAGWWLVSNLRDIVDQLGSPEFEARSWGNSKLPEVCRQAPLTIVAPKRASDLGLVAVAHRSPCKTWSLDAFVENMPSYDITRKSRPVVVTPYQSQWVSDFAEIAGRIRNVINNAAIRIDHIGSTAVPGLAAKDVIDIQITVADLDRADSLTRSLITVGFRQGITFEYESSMEPETDGELRKLYMASLRVKGGRIYISANSGGSISSTRSCFAIIFAPQRSFVRSTSN